MNSKQKTVRFDVEGKYSNGDDAHGVSFDNNNKKQLAILPQSQQIRENSSSEALPSSISQSATTATTIGTHPPSPPVDYLSYTNRANEILQQLRSDEHSSKESSPVDGLTPLLQPSALPKSRQAQPSSLSQTSYIFLEHEDTIKRCLLPTFLFRDIEEIKRLFLRAFPSLHPAYVMADPGVKIYLEKTIGDRRVFRELADVRDVRDRALLKLQFAPEGSPTHRLNIQHLPPAQNSSLFNQSQANHVRWPSDLEENTYGDQNLDHSFSRSNRHCYREYASAQSPHNMSPFLSGETNKPGRYGSHAHPLTAGHPNTLKHKLYKTNSARPDLSFMTQSMSSASAPHFGNTQQRMDAMEQQLLQLSSLVHSALVTPEANLGTGANQLGALSRLRGGIGELQLRNSGSQHKLQLSNGVNHGGRWMEGLGKLLDSVHQTQSELRELEQFTRRSTQEANENINFVRGLIHSPARGRQTANGELGSTADLRPNNRSATATPTQIEQMEEDHLMGLAALQESLRLFETEVERTRKQVLRADKQLKLEEIKQMMRTLAELGRGVAHLRANFVALQSGLEENIQKRIEKVMRDESFLRDEQERMKDCLEQCARVAAVVATMRKLAMVQDPTTPNSNGSNDKRSWDGEGIEIPLTNGISQENEVARKNCDVLDDILSELSQDETDHSPPLP